jgi:hypothetical protein
MSEETPASDKPGDASEDDRRARDAEHKAWTLAQVQPIIEAAEQAATGILEEAEAQARKQIEVATARAEQLAAERAHDMWALTDELIARAEGVKRQADDLLNALEQTRRGVGSALAAAAQAPPPEPEPEPEPDAPPPAGVRKIELEEIEVDRVEIDVGEPISPGPSPPLTEGARLLATQMVVAGSSRAEIARRLQHDFGIEDPDSMLDAIHGIE